MVATAGKSLLFIIPMEGFDAEEFRSSRVSLRRKGIDVKVASLSKDKAVGGIDYYYPELSFEEVNLDEFDGVVFVGGPGAAKLWDNPKALEIARQAATRGKLLAAIGTGVGSLAKAGLLKGVRATGDPTLKDLLSQSGARFSGSQVEPRWLHSNPRRVVTAFDAGASIRFGARIARDLV